MLELRNPHSVIAALRARPGDVARLELPATRRGSASAESGRGSASAESGHVGGPAWQQARELAEQLAIPIGTLEDRGRSGPGDPNREPGRARGPIARVKERAPVSLDQLLARADGEPAGLWLALDSLQDPQNVGAIFRIAAFFGVRGILMPRDRSASITGTVYDVASGGVETVPFAVETNLHRALGHARDAGVWLLGSSEHADRDVYALPHDRPWMLIVGNEERGLRPRTLEACDDIVRVGPADEAGVTSLNVASATAVLVSALSRPSEG